MNAMREDLELEGKMRSDHRGLMNDDAQTSGARVDQLDEYDRAYRPTPGPLRRDVNVRVENSATASGEGNCRDARRATGVKQHGVDYPQTFVGSRMEPGPDHDRVCADFIGGRSGRVHRLPDHGWRHHQSAHRDRRQSLIGSGRKLAALCFLSDNFRLATRESSYELADQDCPQDTENRRSDDDRIRTDSGHHRGGSGVALSNFGNHRAGIAENHRRFSMSVSRPAATMTGRLDLEKRAAIRLARAFFVPSASEAGGLEIGSMK